MVKKILLAIGLISCSLCVNSTVHYMTVELKSAEKFSFLLADNPVITFENSEMNIKNNTNSSFEISNVNNYHFTEDDQTSAENFGADIIRIFNLDENTISVENAVPGANVTLLNAKGEVVLHLTTNEFGSVSLPLPTQKGVYVVTIGKNSLKVIRK